MGDLAQLRVVFRPFARRRYFATHRVRKLHLGCGSRIVEGWLNADKFSSRADIYLDAYRRFPFPDGSFQLVYAEHLIEHIRIDRVERFLREVYRVLEPDGLFRFSCPDLELFASRYVAGDRKFFAPVLSHFERKRKTEPHPKYWVLRTIGGAFMSRAMHFHNHRWMYDFETLRSCLTEIGFASVTKETYRHSVVDEAAAMDGAVRAWESLYIDAIKKADGDGDGIGDGCDV
jgi:predicted SAM-dependent methyltransferase